ncbi:MAG: hypothetical protein II404_06360 [Prevotella sp.]|nr:hypothetical protein [Prevotella sp.]
MRRTTFPVRRGRAARVHTIRWWRWSMTINPATIGWWRWHVYKIVEGESETVLDAETSAKMRSDMGIKPEYDENGNILPMILCNDELVAYLSHDEEFPDDAEFASPIKSIEQVSLFGIDFIKAVISICHEPEETYVPLYFKKEYLPDAKKGTLVRGFLWMQGKIKA